MDAAQPSALVTRPTCSWTSTCCRVVQPPPPSSLGMFVAQSPSSRARVGMRGGQVSGQLAARQLGLLLERDQLVRERRGPAPGCRRSSSVNPYIAASSRRRQRRGGPVLTECSVYASIGLVPMTSPDHRGRRWWSGGGTVGAWCAYFLRRAGLDRVVLLEKGLLGQGASSRAAGVVRMQGGTPDGGAPGPVVPPLLPAPAGRDRHRLRLHRAGLPASLLHRGGGRRGPGADGDADRAGRAGALARPGRGGRGQPHAGAGPDPRRHLLRPGRLHHAAAQRGRLRGGPGPQRRRGPRAGRGSSAWTDGGRWPWRPARAGSARAWSC